MAANLEFRKPTERGPLKGFANLLDKENRLWWGTRRWWTNAILWVGLLGGLTALMLFILPPTAEATGDPAVAAAGGAAAFGMEMGLAGFFELGAAATAIGVIVLCQDLIIDEKQDGTTDWLLAKPISRVSYLLAKLAASFTAVLVLLIVFPSAAAYALLCLRSGSAYSALPFLAGAGMLVVHSLFYLTLTLMLGTFFNSRPPILGIALGILLGGNLLSGILKPLLCVTPWIIGKLAALTAGGQTIPPGTLLPPLVFSFLWAAGFLVLAIWKFERTEF